MTCTSYFKLPLKSKNCVLCLLVVLAVYTIAVTYPLQVFFFRQSQDILRRLTMNQTSRPSSFKASEEWAVAGLVHRPDAADQSLFTTFPWKPDDTKRRQLLSYLNLTQQEASSHLPLTLQGPELLSNDSLCVTEDGSPVDVLFLVHTAPQHFERRRQMRNTFMAEKLFGPLKFKVSASGWERRYQRSREDRDLVARLNWLERYWIKFSFKGLNLHSPNNTKSNLCEVRTVPNQIFFQRSRSSELEQYRAKSAFSSLSLHNFTW